jgi:hypothetical protein
MTTSSGEVHGEVVGATHEYDCRVLTAPAKNPGSCQRACIADLVQVAVVPQTVVNLCHPGVIALLWRTCLGV